MRKKGFLETLSDSKNWVVLHSNSQVWYTTVIGAPDCKKHIAFFHLAVAVSCPDHQFFGCIYLETFALHITQACGKMSTRYRCYGTEFCSCTAFAGGDITKGDGSGGDSIYNQDRCPELCEGKGTRMEGL